jgi:WD40 repeat protein
MTFDQQPPNVSSYAQTELIFCDQSSHELSTTTRSDLSNMASSSSDVDDDDDDVDDTHDDVTQEATSSSPPNTLPSKVIVTVGTYDGVLAGWEWKQNNNNNNKKNQKLEISFAAPVHGGSVRSLCFASAAATGPHQDKGVPGSLLSTGYDETLKTHDWHRRLTSSGEVRTPTDFGTPVCASFAPPQQPYQHQQQQQQAAASTHCLVGFTSGKLIIYKKRDWSVQHVLAGHDGGVASLAVHPTGKLALTGGSTDGKLKLWDLTKGRLSFATKIASSRRVDPLLSLVWSHDGSMYAFCHGSHITVRDVASGEDWCNVELPSRVNQLTLMSGQEGIFVAAACNDGSLPVLAVKTILDQDSLKPEPRRAIMAIEPVEGPVAGEERYKCIHSIAEYFVATANSAGVISLMNLEGAVRMMMTGDNSNNNDEEENDKSDDENPASSDDDSDDEEELAVDILDAVQLGTGARITCLVAWACDDEPQSNDDNENEQPESDQEPTAEKHSKQETATIEVDKKRKNGGHRQEIEMDPKEVEKARALVLKAKMMEKRKDSKRRKVSPGE